MGISPKGLTTVKIQLNQSDRRAILDSGSSVSIIDENLVKAKDIRPTTLKGVRAANDERLRVEGVTKLNFRLENSTTYLSQYFYVIKNFTPEIVLGTDFLKYHRATIDYNRNKIICFSKQNKAAGAIYTQCNHLYTQCNNLKKDNKVKSMKFDLGDNLNCKQKEDLLMLLKEFQDIFSGDGEIPAGNAKVEPARIDLTDDIPVARPPYRCAHRERELIQDEVTKMANAGVIRESTSPYSAPVVLVKKKQLNETDHPQTRFCVDYRLLNKKVKDNKFPMPRTDDFLSHLNGATIFSSIDMKNCFWQLPLSEKDKHKTAFSADSLWEYNVLPFGLKTAPAICQKAMYDAAKGLLWNTVLVYMDDWLIPSKSWEEHLIALRKVFKRLREVNLKVKYEKCGFGKNSIKVLGHRVSEKGISPDEDKLLSVKEFPRPKNVKQVRSWLGLSNYYRMFIPKYAHLTRNLASLTKKNARFQWKEEHEKEYQTIKEKLLTAPVLRHYDPSLETELVIDASDYGIAAIIAQKEKGEKAARVVAYASRNLKEPELRYFTTEKEMLALVFGTTVFRNYLWGIKFTVITDHASLRYWNNIKNPSSRLMRFMLRLSELDFTVVHKAGKLNTAADALSRAPTDDPNYDVNEESLPCLNMTTDNLSTLQLKDPELEAIIKAFEDPNANKFIRRKIRRYIKENDALYKKITHNGQIYKVPVIPQCQKIDILRSIHDDPLTGAHTGRDRCMTKAKTRYFWENMYNDIEEYVRACPECQSFKRGGNQHPRGQLQPIPTSTQPFEHICIDILGPFTKAFDKNRYIITCVDFATRYAEAKAVQAATAEEVATFLYELVTRHGAFRKMSCDRGSQFRSRTIALLLEQIGSSAAFSTAYHPASQGVVERFHASLTNMLAAYTSSDQKDWPWSLPSVLFAYNTCENKSTKFSPFELLYGRQATLPNDAAITNPAAETVDTRLQKVSEWRKKATENIQNAQSKMKEYFDKKRTDVKFKVGDKVMLYVPARKVGRTDKLDPKYHGPLTVRKVISDVNYEVEGKLSSRKNFCDVVHIERLKPYYDDPWRKPEGSKNGKYNNNNTPSPSNPRGARI